MKVAPERSGWRDLELSQRHRNWGFNAPAVDIDYFLAYDNGKAAAIIEYKHARAKGQDLTSRNYQAFVDVANRAGIPAFSARYYPPIFWFRVTPLNLRAAEFVNKDFQDMSELRYVELYYRLRKSVITPDIAAALCDELPNDRPGNIDLWHNRSVRASMWTEPLTKYPYRSPY
jgi:ketosteroid isomerase-like protein